MAPATIQPPVGTAPHDARGEVLLPVENDPAAKPYPVRFGMRVLRDYTRTTNSTLADLSTRLGEDLVGTVADLVATAVRIYVPGAVYPAGYSADDALDLIDRLTQQQGDELFAAVMQAIRIDQHPLLAAVIRSPLAAPPTPQAEAPATSGADTSTLPTAN